MKSIKVTNTGGPEVLKLEDISLEKPGADEVQIEHVSIAFGGPLREQVRQERAGNLSTAVGAFWYRDALKEKKTITSLKPLKTMNDAQAIVPLLRAMVSDVEFMTLRKAKF